MKPPRHLVLVGRTPIAVDMMTWAKWFEKSGRRRIVAQDRVGKAQVSTIFLGLDHGGFITGGPPILFETMIFGGPLDGDGARYATYREAEKGHAEFLTRAREAHVRIKKLAKAAGAKVE